MSTPRSLNPLIVQGDFTVLAEVDSPRFAEARDALARFAELVKSPEHVHTYRITPLSIWNACAAGIPADDDRRPRSPSSRSTPCRRRSTSRCATFAARYGRVRMERDARRDDELHLVASDAPLAEELSRVRQIAPLLAERLAPDTFRVRAEDRGRLKQALVQAGFPAEDLAGYTAGEPLRRRSCAATTRAGAPFALRAYQTDAAAAFHAGGAARGGSGVVVLPCGAGKTVVGMACMARVRASTLILTTSVTAVRQWIARAAGQDDARRGRWSASTPATPRTCGP